MKHILLVSLIGLGLLLFVLYITNPDEEDYKTWLADRYDISCPDDSVFLCKQGSMTIDWQSQHVESALLYTKVQEIYSDHDTAIVIRAFGILGHFYAY
ncbi:hypothetical protein DFQ01_11950 [Paenibacillus cellulosilyticus]|uniref:Uncharacterized protein n=1 Tax=Paenibacillus cellulosilyticus TaxID=375489 RepID=A0A2V2YQI3_9BACL|nr:hypothetical protein [Paenibacillus cellulosilyticus]PWV97968.1 hypothetical protein DFQ01_11950 [Paenibacillus cellulosilyticus]QKS44002.1 hypothetical protein HUB94_05840 [Paenibacillus cellulosilyticus]